MMRRMDGAIDSRLERRTLRLRGRSLNLRVEPSYWEALDEIGEREGVSIEEICAGLLARVDRENGDRVSAANALRALVVGYFRRAATESGHGLAGHGRGDPFVATPFDGVVTGSPDVTIVRPNARGR